MSEIPLAAMVLGLIDDVHHRLPRLVAERTDGSTTARPLALALSLAYASEGEPVPVPPRPLSRVEAGLFLAAHDRPVRLDTRTLREVPAERVRHLVLHVVLEEAARDTESDPESEGSRCPI